MIRFPTSIADATGSERRSGGTDLMDRRHLGIHHGDVVDLRDVPGMNAMVETGDGIEIGAKVTIQALADHPSVREHLPGLAQAAGGLATPQIRAVATVGGNLLQRTRCNHFRAGDKRCLKLGGPMCPADAGDNLWHAIFSTGPCRSVNPSTLGVALACYGAQVTLLQGGTRSMAELYGQAQAPDREHELTDSDVLMSVLIPYPAPGEKGTWIRAASRARAEWPLVEVVARRGPNGAFVAAGGVSPVPIRLLAVEAALRDGASDAAAAGHATEGQHMPERLPYKSRLLINTVRLALERIA